MSGHRPGKLYGGQRTAVGRTGKKIGMRINKFLLNLLLVHSARGLIGLHIELQHQTLQFFGG
jgi:hypothetical protein